MKLRLSALLSFVLSLVFAGASSAQSPVQNVVTSSYSFYWTLSTSMDNAPITSATVVEGEQLVLRFWLREASGGNALSSNTALGNGLGGYDTRFTFDRTQLQVPLGSGAATAVNTNVTPNPYGGTTTPPGFFNAGFRNSSTDAANANGTFTASRNSSPLDSSNWVRTDSTFVAPVGSTGSTGNFVGTDGSNNVLLTQIRFNAVGVGTSTLTGEQNIAAENFAYFLDGNNVPFFLDPLIGTASSSLTIIVAPVPEPATVLAAATVGLGAVGYARRRRSARVLG